jgi:TipAS antibiotic-recognition domain
MSKEAWASLKAEGETVNQALASMIHRNPEEADVKSMIARHHATAEMYKGLGSLYVEHPEFRAYYEKYAMGLPEFLQRSMTIYADCVLEQEEG